MAIELGKEYRLTADRLFEYFLDDGKEAFINVPAGSIITPIAEVNSDLAYNGNLHGLICQVYLDHFDDVGMALCGEHILEEIE